MPFRESPKQTLLSAKPTPQERAARKELQKMELFFSRKPWGIYPVSLQLAESLGAFAENAVASEDFDAPALECLHAIYQKEFAAAEFDRRCRGAGGAPSSGAESPLGQDATAPPRGEKNGPS
ncbi:MAG: hypothetical protein LBO66_08340 [Deltaproteobacteria bacterium]|jgi:hypothetical protein|nr:hypothetical protein [Deltaproteobacteria bacterium]